MPVMAEGAKMINFITLGGFLGAGKTTTMVQAAKRLEARGRRVAVITNDQGVDLVDTQLVRANLDAAAGVTGGCFCCRFDDMVSVTRALLDRGDGTDTVIAEAVGSCTDMQATVVRPMREFYGQLFRMAPLTTVVDPLRYRAFARSWDRGGPESDLSYLFRQQLVEADVIGLNKIDMVEQSVTEHTAADLARRFPSAAVVAYSASTGAGLGELLTAWDSAPAAGQVLAIDYDRYAAAEADLAWLNQTFHTEAAGEFSPVLWADAALRSLAAAAQRAGATIGHAKLTVSSPAGLTKMSVTEAGTEPSVDLTADAPVVSAEVTVNARIAWEPAELDAAVAAAARAADAATGARSTAAPANAFRPSYPRPVHRFSAGVD
jgi:G3E family GTPase